MAANSFFTTPIMATLSFVNADGTTQKDLIPTLPSPITNTVGPLGGRAFSLSFTNDDVASITMVVNIFDGANTRLFREVIVPASAGIGATPPEELFVPAKLPAMNSVAALLDGWPLNPNSRIRINAKTAVPASRTVTAVFSGGNG